MFEFCFYFSSCDTQDRATLSCSRAFNSPCFASSASWRIWAPDVSCMAKFRSGHSRSNRPLVIPTNHHLKSHVDVGD